MKLFFVENYFFNLQDKIYFAILLPLYFIK
ncbi:Uncharacterised protein [Moraxella lacunata]|uniref:Uncharacterized protein n=1 Tax=Moraxella lacunata TaxID=477 RepID=A0A378QHM0_MORLA|nr:Uncharacterised protein [Moraxella lacunata]